MEIVPRRLPSQQENIDVTLHGPRLCKFWSIDYPGNELQHSFEVFLQLVQG